MAPAGNPRRIDLIGMKVIRARSPRGLKLTPARPRGARAEGHVQVSIRGTHVQADHLPVAEET